MLNPCSEINVVDTITSTSVNNTSLCAPTWITIDNIGINSEYYVDKNKLSEYNINTISSTNIPYGNVFIKKDYKKNIGITLQGIIDEL